MPIKDLDREILEGLLDTASTTKEVYEAEIMAITNYIGYDSDELSLTDDELVEMDVDELLELIREVEAEG